MVTDPETLEFWPEYDSGPLWAADGEPVPLDELPLPDELRSRLMAWNDEFENAKLPFDQHDEDWLQRTRPTRRGPSGAGASIQGLGD